MSSSEEGPLKRLVRKLGLGKSSGGGTGVYASCWACFNGRCGIGFERGCACCRANHSGSR